MKKRFSFFLFILLTFNFFRCNNTPTLNHSYFSQFTDLKLNITVTGIGKGKIVSNRGGINCSKSGGSCTTLIKPGSDLTLTAEPENGYTFLGWYGGECQGKIDCQITLDQPKQIKAAFGMIAFLSNDNNPTFNIWIAKTDGSEAYPLTQLKNANSQFPRWSPDGTQLIYQSSRALDGTDQDIGHLNIWKVNADGSDHRPLTQLTQADSYLPQWSPDGTKIVYGSFRALDGSNNINKVSNIWRMNADGSDHRPLTQLTQAGNYEPQWSPNGTQILYESSRSLNGADQNNGHYNIWKMNADGSDHRPLTQLTQADSYLPQWSPDGAEISYQSFQSLNPRDSSNKFSNIWKMSSEGTNHRPLTQLTQAGAYSSQWSPDGTQILYESSRSLDGTDQNNGHYNIWKMNANGSDHRPLTQLTQADSYLPQRLGSENEIMYGSSQALDGTDQGEGFSNIWVMNLEKFEKKPLTQSKSFHNFLQLIPD